MNRNWVGAVAAALIALKPADAGAQSKSPRPLVAALVSLGATALPMAAGAQVINHGGRNTRTALTSATLLWGGAIIGPAAGYWYGGQKPRGNTGLAIRGAAFLAASLLAPTTDLDDGVYPNSDLDDIGPWLVAIPVIATSMAVDLLSVRAYVDGSRIAVTPVVDPKARSAGLALRVTW
jgi:hypothetical protein